MSDDNSMQNPGREEPSLNETELNDWVRALYGTCDMNWRFFLEYRQKFLFRFIVTLAAVFAVGSWLLTNDHWEYLWIPPLILAILSWVFLQIEKRTSTLLVGCHFVGDRIERLFARSLQTLLEHECPRTISPYIRKKMFSSEWKQQWNALVRAAENHRYCDCQISEHVTTVVEDDSKIQPNPIGFFTALTVSFDIVSSHSATLRWLYSLTCLISVVASVVLLVIGIILGTSWLENFAQKGTITRTGAAVLAVIAVLLTVVTWAVIHRVIEARSLRSARQQPSREETNDETSG